jgi:AcrR family transcriptional regulator
MRDSLSTALEADGPDLAAGTRAALLASAERLFLERGYHTTSIDDISSGADVTRTAFYRYFRTKFDVLAVFSEIMTANVAASVAGIAAIELTDTSALARLFDQLFTVLASEAWVVRCWGHALGTDPRQVGVTRKDTERVIDALAKRLVTLHSAARPSRAVRDRARAVALVLNAQLQGLVNYWFLYEGELDRPQQIGALALSWRSTIAAFLGD